MFVRLLARYFMRKDDERGGGPVIAGAIVLAVIISYYLFVPLAQDRILAEILADITTMGEFAEDGELLMEMADSAHAAALWAVHNMRNSVWWGPRNEEAYIEAFFEEIVRDAQYRDRKDLQGPLRRLQHELRRRKRKEWGR